MKSHRKKSSYLRTIRDTERIEMLWDYIIKLNFNGEVTMDRNDEGYEIQFTWKDWSKNG